MNILNGKNHLVKFFLHNDLDGKVAMAVMDTAYNNDELSLHWFEHFDKHTRKKRKGVLRMLVTDGASSQVHCVIPKISCLFDCRHIQLIFYSHLIHRLVCTGVAGKIVVSGVPRLQLKTRYSYPTNNNFAEYRSTYRSRLTECNHWSPTPVRATAELISIFVTENTSNESQQRSLHLVFRETKDVENVHMYSVSMGYYTNLIRRLRLRPS